MASEALKPRRVRALLALALGCLPRARRQLGLALGLSLVELACIVGAPLVGARVIDALQLSSWVLFRRYVSVAALLAVAQVLVGLARGYRFVAVDEGLASGLRRAVFRGVLRKDYGFLDTRWSGDLISRTINDTGVLKTFLTATVLQALLDGLTVVVVAAVLISMNAELALLTMGLAPLSLAYTRTRHRQMEAGATRVRERVASVTNQLQSWFSKLALVKAHALEDTARARFETEDASYLQAAIGLGRMGMRANAVNATILGLPSLLIFGYGGYVALHGGLSLGQLFAFMTYSTYFSSPLQRLTGLYLQLPTLFPVEQRLRELVVLPDERESAASGGPARFDELAASGLLLEGGAQRPTRLELPDFSARPGQLVAVAGPNGSGKSTLLRLLLGLQRPSAGRIELRRDGRRFEPRPEYFGFLPQHPTLFEGNVLENLTLFEETPDRERLAAVIEDVGLGPWVRQLPRGLETETRTINLPTSAGELQRLSLVRLLYRDPPVWLLDEPETNLDAEGLSMLERVVAAAAVDHIVVIVSHASGLLGSRRVYRLQARPDNGRHYICRADGRAPAAEPPEGVSTLDRESFLS